MTFTDEDLKRLKEYMEAKHPMFPGTIGWAKIEAVLNRMEAAEEFIADGNSDNYEAWRKACGK